jgi:radical SAM protein with 4Fe4S-binding SPASM domain
MWTRVQTYFSSVRNGVPAAPTVANSRFPDVARPAYPRYFMLDTGNVCNLRCPFCPTGLNAPEVKRGLMTRGDFDVILSKIAPHARFVSMVNWNEPFLNKNLLYFASRFDAHGVQTHIDSNLCVSAWTDAEAQAIVTSGLNSILASIDGATQEAYSKYRVKGDLRMALGNLRALQAAKTRLGLSRPFVGWAFYVNKFNEDEIELARAMARDLGVEIWFKLLSCNDPSWRSKYHFDPDPAVLATPAWVARIYPDWRAPSIVEAPLHPALPGPCVLPFGFMVINFNGDVFPCDVVYGEKYRLGNLLTQSVDEIWFGSEYAKCRSFLRNYGPRQDSHSVCQGHTCAVHQKWIPSDAPKAAI